MKIMKSDRSRRDLSRQGSPDSFSELVERFFSDDFFSGNLLKSDWNAQSLKVDIFEKGNDVVVQADIPGVQEKDISVEIEGRVLTIQGKREEKRETSDRNYHRYERSFGSFSRSIELPEAVKMDKSNAVYKNGVLTITFPKEKADNTKKISVKIA